MEREKKCYLKKQIGNYVQDDNRWTVGELGGRERVCEWESVTILSN